MAGPARSGFSRIGVVLIVAVVSVALVGGLFVAHKWRKRMMVEEALDVGLAAYEKQDWEAARVKLGQYLSVHREDVDVLRKYAEAQLSTDPLPVTNIAQAIGAYRQIFRMDPTNTRAFERLVLLYRATRNLGELAHISKMRLEAVPDDPAATLARVQLLLSRQEEGDARALLTSLIESIDDRPENAAALAEASVILAELTMRAEEADATAKALALLDTAGERATPAPLVHVFRAAILRSMAEETGANAAQVRAALERAEAEAADDPRALLALAQEWTNEGDFERADAVLSRARALPRVIVREHFVDPLDWTINCFFAEADLCLRDGRAERGAELVEKTLAELEGNPRHASVLPMAVRLYVAADRVEAARRCLTEYVDVLEDRGAALAADTTVSMLRALVAAAEDRPYEVIAQLEPMAKSGRSNASVEGMLVEAYSRTGQVGRMATVLGTSEARRGRPVAATIRLARTAIGLGDYAGAIELLDEIDPDRLADPIELAVLRLSARIGRSLAGGGVGREVDPLVDELRVLRDAHPERADIRIMLAFVAEARGDLAAAESELVDAVASVPNGLSVSLALARFYGAQDRDEDALATLRAACEKYGERARPWLSLTDMLVARDDVAAARKVLAKAREAVSEEADRLQVEVRLATLDLIEGPVDAGVTRLLELAAANPTDVRIRTVLLQVPSILPDAETVQRLIDELRALEGETGLNWRLAQARLWLRGADWAQHTADLERELKYCLEADPTRAEAVLLLGETYERQGRIQDAERAYRSGLDVAGASAVIDRLLALLQRQGRYDEARALLDRYQRQLGQDVAAARRLSLALDTGAHDEAIAELEVRVSRAQSDPADLLRLANLMYARDGAVDLAFEQLDEAAERGASPIEVARVRVSILQAEGRMDEAAQQLDELVEQEGSGEALALRGVFWAANGDPERAEADFQRLAEISGDLMGPAMLGEFYARRGDLDEAIATWDASLAEHPDSVRLRRGLCKALLLRNKPGDLDRVGELLEQLRALTAEVNVEWLWLAAKRLAALGVEGRRGEIRRYLERACSANPAGGPDAYVDLCDMAIRLSELDTAQALALRGIEAYGPARPLRAQQALIELLRGKVSSAADRAVRILEEEPGHRRALEILAAAGAQLDDSRFLDQALAQVDTALRAAPAEVDLHLLRAETLLAQGKPKQAIAGLDACLEIIPEAARVPLLLKLTEIHRMEGDLVAAERVIEEALALAPATPGVRMERMQVWADREAYDVLAAEAESLSETESASGPLLLQAAVLLSRSPAHRAEVLKLCERVLTIAPRNPGALMTVGNLQFDAGDLAGAEASFRKVLSLSPEFPEALNNLAWVLATAPDAEEADVAAACDYARRAVDAAPQAANYHDTLATALLQAGRVEEARAALARAADLLPADSAGRARTLLKLARVSQQLEDRSGAGRYAREALAAEQAVAAAGGARVFDERERREIAALREAAQEN